MAAENYLQRALDIDSIVEEAAASFDSFVCLSIPFVEPRQPYPLNFERPCFHTFFYLTAS